MNRRPFKQAIATKTLVELMRRHPELRLIELHPGGGQYDSLGLWRGDLQVMCQFNLAGTSLVVGDLGERSPRSDKPGWWRDGLWRYPQVWAEHDLLLQMQERLGLQPAQPGPPRPHTLALGVVAELCARLSFSEATLTLRAGWCDSSGMGGSFLTEWCPPYPGSKDPNAWRKQARWGTRFWSISHQGGQERLTLDLKTGAIQGGMDLWGLYKRGAGIRELAWQLEKDWRALQG